MKKGSTIVFVIPTGNTGNEYLPEYNVTANTTYEESNLLKNKLIKYPWNVSENILLPLFGK